MKNKSFIDITNHTAILVIIHAILLDTGWDSFFSATGSVMNILIIITIGICALSYILSGNYAWTVFFISMVSVFILFFTLLHGNSISARTVIPIAFAMSADLGLRRNPLKYLRSWVILAAILLPINLLTILIYPNGITTPLFTYSRYWLLGYYGDKGFPIFSMTILIYPLFKYGRLLPRHYGLLLIIVITGFLGGSETTIVSTLVLSLFIALFFFFKIPKICNYTTYIIGIFSFFIGIVLLRLQYRLSWLIEDILHKSLSFTYRTDVWDYALADFASKPFIGAGENYQFFVYISEIKEIADFRDAHNLFVTTLHAGGIFAFLALMIVLYRIGIPLMKYRTNKIVQVLSFTIFAWMLTAMTWTFHIYSFLVPLFVMASHSKTLIREYEAGVLQRLAKGRPSP